jgi:hypothetical protein
MNDNEVFQEVIKENDPQFLEQARQEFPRLKELDIGYKYTPREDRGFIEFYPADERVAQTSQGLKNCLWVNPELKFTMKCR